MGGASWWGLGNFMNFDGSSRVERKVHGHVGIDVSKGTSVKMLSRRSTKRGLTSSDIYLSINLATVDSRV
jgi:hypothetical protein